MGNNAIIKNNKKQCRLCLEWKDISLFGTFLDKKKNWVAPRRYINSRCKTCAVKATKNWWNNNREELLQRHKKINRENKDIVFNHYGKYCACCGETNEMFLTFDHVNNDGNTHRRRDSKGKENSHAGGFMLKWIIKNNFPNSIQILCWNCNCGKQRNKGICPHKM